MSVNYLEVIDLEYRRDNHLLFSKLSFSMQPGDAKQIRGQNGVGKTSLLRCLAGFSRAASGEIKWRGTSIYQDDNHKEQLLFIGHKNAVKEKLTVQENLNFSPSLKTKADAINIKNALERMELAHKNNDLAKLISAGQKQRLALARLLLIKAKLWILDEPFTALDAKGQSLLIEIMTEHLEQNGMIIFTSHQAIQFPTSNFTELDLTPFARRAL